jgi:DNA polymerase III sliding clamp (beta) subunit (PCNA family)
VEVFLNPKAFLARLRIVGALTGRRYPNPILETVRLEVTDRGVAHLRATDHDASICLSAPILKVLQAGTVQIPLLQVAKALNGLATGSATLRDLPPETLPIAQDPKTPTRQLVLSIPAGALTFPTFDPAQFPTPRSTATTAEVELPAWRFSRLITRTQYAADEHATRYALGG